MTPDHDRGSSTRGFDLAGSQPSGHRSAVTAGVTEVSDAAMAAAWPST